MGVREKGLLQDKSTRSWDEDVALADVVTSLHNATPFVDPQNLMPWYEKHLRFAAEHIAAQAGPLESPDYKATGGGTRRPLLIVLGTSMMLKDYNFKAYPGLSNPLLALMELAASKGAAVNGRTSKGVPVLFSVASFELYDLRVLTKLIELGADADPGGPYTLGGLMGLAEKTAPGSGARTIEDALGKRRSLEIERTLTQAIETARSGAAPAASPRRRLGV